MSIEKIKEFNELDLAHVQIEVKRAFENAVYDPSDSMTSAENILVATFKGILTDKGLSWNPKASAMQLFSAVLESLEILPQNTSEVSKGKDSARKILRSMGAATQGLSELRNLYGDSHGKAPGFRGLQTRHARLIPDNAFTKYLRHASLGKGPVL